VDRTTSLQWTMEEITQRRVEIQRDPETQEDFIQHVTALFEKKEKDKHGAMKLTIESKGADHYAHANNYASLLERRRNDSLADIILV